MAAGQAGYANRGRALELAIEQANASYRAHGIAVVEKVAVPTKVIRDNRTDGPLKVVREKSSVDFIGTWQGVPVAFDAKETNVQALPLANIHDHQYEFMRRWEAAGGRAFLLIWYGPDAAVYLMPMIVLVDFWGLRRTGGPASIPGDEIRRLPKVRPGRGCTLDYLSVLDSWIRSAPSP